MQNILYGYEEEFNLLSFIYNNGKLPNKILFSGKKGIGKSLTANHFVNYILSKNEEHCYDMNNKIILNNNKSFKLVENRSHPNFFNIFKKEDKKFIEISQIRELNNFVNKSSFNDFLKIILIEDVEYLTTNASNSLLKLVEEPNNNVQFILIHDNSKFILDTLKSRCIEFKFTLEDKFIPLIVDKIFEQQVFCNINEDFKYNYLTPHNYFNLINFCNKENISINDATINVVLSKIINKSLYKFNRINIDELKLYLEIFFKKLYIKKKNKKFLEYANFYNQKFYRSIKYNLDLESFFIEFNNEFLLWKLTMI